MNNNMINADVIILAAGSGKRMMADKNKILLDLGDRPIIAHTIAKFYNHPRVRKIILAIREEDRVQIDSIIDAYGFEDIVAILRYKKTGQVGILKSLRISFSRKWAPAIFAADDMAPWFFFNKRLLGKAFRKIFRRK